MAELPCACPASVGAAAPAGLAGALLRLLPSCWWCDDDDEWASAGALLAAVVTGSGGVGACRPVGRASAAHAEGRAAAVTVARAGLGDLELWREVGADRRVW